MASTLLDGVVRMETLNDYLHASIFGMLLQEGQDMKQSLIMDWLYFLSGFVNKLHMYHWIDCLNITYVMIDSTRLYYLKPTYFSSDPLNHILHNRKRRCNEDSKPSSLGRQIGRKCFCSKLLMLCMIKRQTRKNKMARSFTSKVVKKKNDLKHKF